MSSVENLGSVVGSRHNFSASFQRSRWAEDHTVDLVAQAGLVAVHYGASESGVNVGAPKSDRAEYTEWFASTESEGKRPDLLVYHPDEYDRLWLKYRTGTEATIDILDKLANDQIPSEIVRSAVAAIEVENSVWYAKQMKDYGKPAPKKFKGTDYDGIGFTKSASAPNIFLKKDDKDRLDQWCNRHEVPLFMSAFFFDSCFLLDIRAAEAAISTGHLEMETYVYGKNEKKEVYKIWYTLAEPFADMIEDPEPKPVMNINNGKVVAEVSVEGGTFSLSSEARKMLAGAVSEAAARQ